MAQHTCAGFKRSSLPARFALRAAWCSPACQGCVIQRDPIPSPSTGTLARAPPRAGVRYVVDAGRAKAKRLEAGGALARYDVGWVSKAAAEQRAGRAGRTGPGHCYRRVRLLRACLWA